jgi:multicomponent Na+:H+ antiporter subunit D
VIADQLPILQVVIPLLAAPLCLLARDGRLAWALSQAAALAALAVSVALLLTVQADGPISYAIGGWAAPYGIEYRIDLLAAYVLLLISFIGAVALPYAARSAAAEVDAPRLPFFYSAWLLCVAGLLGITATGDAFNLFVFLEISSLSTYILVGLGRDRRALTAAYQYLIMGTIGATFILIGVGLLYMMTGTLNMADLAERLPALTGTRTVRAALAFLCVGISLKLALFPLHLWLPNAYAYAPSVVSVLLAATATKVAAYVLLRFVFTVFGAEFVFGAMRFDTVLLPLALVAVFSASATAIFQDNVKRLFAYSSVAQIGYIVLGISLATPLGLTAAILHLFNHALMKGALFMALGCVAYRAGAVNLDAMAGLAKRMPWTFAAIVAGGLSLVGVPLTVGFISKWYLVQAALEDGMWWVAALVLAGSLLAVIYVWRVVEAGYLRAPAADTVVREAPLSLIAPTWILVAANVYFGVNTDLTAGLAGRAAALLMGGVP